MSYDYKLVSAALTKNFTVASEEATEFANRVSKALRVKMHERDLQSYWLYRDDCPYCLGWVGYGDYRNGGDGTKMYVVQARTIKNGKYSDYSPQYHISMSVNIDTALRNAKKFIRMMSPMELAKSRLKDASTAVDSVVQTAHHQYRKARGEALDVETSMYSTQTNPHSKLMSELRHLLTINHEFVNPTFAQDLRDMFEKGDELERLSKRTVPMWFVRVYERFGAQHFDVTDIDNTKSYYSATISEEVKRYTAETLPEEIMQKLAVLNILDKDDYVDDVGFNAGEGMFYVVR